MSKELIDRLKSYIPSGDGHNSQYANDLADAVELLEAADALEAKAAPAAYITGQFAGRCIIEPINRAAVLPTGMALYSHPQPSAGVVMPERKTAADYPGYVDSFAAEAAAIHNACLEEFARLNSKEVGRG